MVILHFLLLLVSCFLAQSPREVAVPGNTDKETNLFKFHAIFKLSFKKLSIILVIFSFTHLSGITVITTFLVDIFSSFGIAEIVLVMVSSVSEMVSSFLQIMVANRIGR